MIGSNPSFVTKLKDPNVNLIRENIGQGHGVGVGMIEKLQIQNFKSIKELDLDCGRVNIFIGKPNAGKSNILEALGFCSWLAYRDGPLREFVRYQTTSNIYYDDLFEKNPITFYFKRKQPVISGNGKEKEEDMVINEDTIVVEYKSARFDIINHHEIIFSNRKERNVKTVTNVGQLDFNGPFGGGTTPPTKFINFYRYNELSSISEQIGGPLLPPNGSNMFTCIYGSRTLRDSIKNIFSEFGFQLVFKPQERIFEFQKQIDDDIYIYPYLLTSDTVKRLVFLTVAIESNKNSTLVFEEPESHAFPYYTKYLGEKIAMDESNQYFIATHNPYLLESIIAKTKKEDINVLVTYFQDYQTKVKRLNSEEISELLDADPFFNLELFIEK